MSGAGGKWMASSVTKGHIKRLHKAGYLSNDIVHRLPDEGQIIPPPGPMSGWCSFPISSMDWAFHSTHLSGGSCSTMAWISMICP